MLNPEWYDAITDRVSRRRFTGDSIDPDRAERLRRFCAEFRPFETTRTVFVQNAPEDVFIGFVGSYGRVEGAPSVAVFVGPRSSDLELGYLGEAFVLEATRLGLGTCWLAGSFSRKTAASLVTLAPGERVPAVTPVGIVEPTFSSGERSLRTIVRASSRKPLETIAPNAGPESWPEWALTALEAARLAPSGSNRQPWRFRMDGEQLVLYRTKRPYWTTQLDLGIAMLHAQLGAQHAGVYGSWESAEAPDVARFVPSAS